MGSRIIVEYRFREMIDTLSPGIRLHTEAKELMYDTIEDYIRDFITRTVRITENAERSTIMEKDVQLAISLGGL